MEKETSEGAQLISEGAQLISEGAQLISEVGVLEDFQISQQDDFCEFVLHCNTHCNTHSTRTERNRGHLARSKEKQIFTKNLTSEGRTPTFEGLKTGGRLAAR